MAVLRKEGFRILGVDADPLVREFMKKAFRPPRYIVETAENGKEGLEVAKRFKPDLIISDVVMPEMDGFAFCKALRADVEFANTIFLLSSATATEAKDAIRGLKGGADDYLLKPLEEEQTRAKVDAFLRIKVLQDSLLDTNRKLHRTVAELQKHKKKLEEANRQLAEEKEMLKNSFKEVSFLMNELDSSNKHFQELSQKYEANFNAMVELLSTIVDLRHPRHKGRPQRVAKIAKELGKVFITKPTELKTLEIAALLHDLGTVGLPDALLQKNPADYTPVEEEMVLQHPLVGQSLLESYEGLEEVAKVIRHLHENYDGTGIPDHLAGEEIPVQSRIIRVAKDYAEAVSASGKGLSPEDALREMRLKVGRFYDPLILAELEQYAAKSGEAKAETKTRLVRIADLKEGMVLSQDLFTSTGIMLMPHGTKLTSAGIKCILNYNRTDTLPREILVNSD